MFYNIQNFSFENIDKFSASSLVTRLTTDVTNVQMAYMMIIRIAIRCPLMLIFAFVMAFVMGGKMAAIFLFSGANVMPTSTNNRKAIEKRLAAAEEAVTDYVDSLHLGLPVPACYLHPVTVERMQRAVREGRAESVEDAFDVVKNDLKKTNADVSVTQEEFDEIMAIKPVFLVRDYV